MRFLKRLFLGEKDQHDIRAGAYPFLVTGCGRSGTHFTAKFLELNGLDIGHEATGAMGAVGWLCASPEFCREQGATFARKAHQIRHPVSAIRSFHTLTGKTWKYVFRYAPQCHHPDPLIVAARYWVYWNEMALAGAELSVRLEDFSLAPAKTAERLEAFFGKKIDPALIATAQSFGDSRKARSDYGHNIDMDRIRKEDPATWSQLEALAQRFDYDPAQPL